MRKERNNEKLDHLAIDTIRTLSMDAVQKANSGHPGTPMAMAPVEYVLWDRFLRHAPSDPRWIGRDRFILSAGHASMMLYSILHISGYDVSLDDIREFRQLDGKCAGHPENGLIKGLECTTGPLGQGAAMSVGFAIAEKWLAAFFNRPGNKILDYNIFALLSDGCMMEGISSEAASLAGHLGLGNLVWIYDNNHITIEGETSLAFSENVEARFRGYGWRIFRVADANDLGALEATFEKAIAVKQKPSLVIVDSHIAYGAPNKQDTAAAHGSPLGEDEVRAAKEFYGWDPDRHFFVPEEISSYRASVVSQGEGLLKDWNRRFEAYRRKHPELAAQLEMIIAGEPPSNIADKLPAFPTDPKGLATRAANGKILNSIASDYPWLLGGSADLAPSNNTLLSSSGKFSKTDYTGRNLHFGIRENSMGAIVNGLALSGLRAYGATFLVFSDYMRPTIRLAAMMELPTILIYTHDSIGLGEDGPTHQPIEHLASLRAIPNLLVIRPADANELSVLWRHILALRKTPAALILSRQSLPVIDRAKFSSAEGALHGAYILADCEGEPEIILISTGSEVSICLVAYERLKSDGISARLVSMPCRELFENQDERYRNEVLPPAIENRIVVEAASPLGWERYAGSSGIIIGMNQFGASAPYKELYAKFGFTSENIAMNAGKLVGKKSADIRESGYNGNRQTTGG